MFLNISAELWRFSSPDCLPLLAGRGFDAPSRLARRRAGRGFDALLPPSPRARPRDVCFGLASGLVPRRRRRGRADAQRDCRAGVRALAAALHRRDGRERAGEARSGVLGRRRVRFRDAGRRRGARGRAGILPVGPGFVASFKRTMPAVQRSSNIRSSSPRVSFHLRLIAETTVSDFTKPAVLRFSLAGLAERLEANVTCYATRKDGVAVRAVTARCLQGFALCAAWSGRAPEPSQRILSRVT